MTPNLGYLDFQMTFRNWDLLEFVTCCCKEISSLTVFPHLSNLKKFNGIVHQFLMGTECLIALCLIQFIPNFSFCSSVQKYQVYLYIQCVSIRKQATTTAVFSIPTYTRTCVTHRRSKERPESNRTIYRASHHCPKINACSIENTHWG